MATSVLKAQEKEEEKREKKRAKKLLKQMKQQSPTVEDEIENPDMTVKPKKKKITQNIDEAPKSKKVKVLASDDTTNAETNSKKKKTVAAPESTDEVHIGKKKSKKRKFGDTLDHEDQEKPEPKRLGILEQIEGKTNFSKAGTNGEGSKGVSKEQSFPMPFASQKLKKIIPENVSVEKRKKKKKSGNKVIPEPQISPPKPVWTSSGVFLEEPKSPYKFTSTKYVPIKTAGSSTNFGVVVFDAKKKKAAQPAQDYRTQQILRNKNRDGSMKNIRGLLGQRNTY